MTLTPVRAHDSARPHSPSPTVTVTAVLLLGAEPPRPAPDRDGSDPLAGSVVPLLDVLATTLDALADQTHLPERLVAVVPGGDAQVLALLSSHRIRRAVATVVTQVPHGHRLGDQVQAAMDATPDAQSAVAHAERGGGGAGAGNGTHRTEALAPVEHLWFLTADSRPDHDALALLLQAVRSSESAAIAGPKLVQWDRPDRLSAVGVQITRTGRLIPAPPVGQPDQGQYDRRADVLAVPLPGLLVERQLYAALGGFDPTLGSTAGAVDLAWRAYLTGRRVVVVPRARVEYGASDLSTPASRRRQRGRDRRQTRRVALTRCSLLVAPLLAAWVVASSLVAAVALLLAKRPGPAWTELADAGSIVNPWRTVAARLRFRSRAGNRIRRRHLHGLFVTSRVSVRTTLDLLQDVVLPETTSAEVLTAPDTAEPGPVDEQSQDLNVMTTSVVARGLRNPGFLAALVAFVAAAAATRTWRGSPVGALRTGLAGGELTPGRSDAGGLWHAWLDGWHGAGLGAAALPAPHLPVVAGVAWALEHLPLVDTDGSSVPMAVSLLLVLALPLAAVSAYLAARVVTRSRTLRAVAALAWAFSAVATTAVGGGRLGPALAAVLLPAAAAGIARAASRRGAATAAFAGALAATLVVALVPLLLPVLALAAVVLLLFGRGAARWRALPFLVVPAVLLGPWLLAALRDPVLLLGGPGATQWGSPGARPWELALLHPGGPGGYPVLLSVPLVAAAALGLLRAGRGAAQWSLAGLAVVGLAGAVAAPQVLIGRVPEGQAAAGAPITVWSGAPLLVYALAVVVLALMAAAGLARTRTAGGWAAVARIPVVAAVTAAVLAGAGSVAWLGLGTQLRTWTDPRPAVAIDQAEGPLANRMVVVTPGTDRYTYSIAGREVTDVARGVPAAPLLVEPLLARSISHALSPSGASSERPAEGLAALGVGFVGLHTATNSPEVATLDATAGLSRLGSREGVILWRVLPESEGVSGPPRVRVVSAAATANGSGVPVPVFGEHATTGVALTPGPDRTVVVAEPAGWADHAVVRANGVPISATSGTGRPTYAIPDDATRLSISVPPTNPRWSIIQGILAVTAVFLALPLGRRRRRTS